MEATFRRKEFKINPIYSNYILNVLAVKHLAQYTS